MIQSMTIEQFINRAFVYEYSQDHYNFKRDLYELDLVTMHVESYDFLHESSLNLSLDQLDFVMVESGFSDRSNATHSLFIEKSDGLIGRIGDFFRMIGRAIRKLFERIAGVFNGGNKKADEYKSRCEHLEKKLENVQLVSDVTHLTDATREGISVAKSASDNIIRSANTINEKVEAMFGQHHMRIISPPPDTAITTVTNHIMTQLESMPQANTMRKENIRFMLAICHERYMVQAPLFIKYIDRILEEVKKVLFIKTDGISEDILYDSMKSSMNDFRDKIRAVTRTIKEYQGQSDTMEMSASVLDEKKRQMDELTKYFESIADTSKVGDTYGYTSFISLLAMFSKTGTPEARTEHDMKNDAAHRLKTDPDFKPGWNPIDKFVRSPLNKRAFIKEYPAFLSMIHELSTTLQVQTATMSKVLIDHMMIRNQCLEEFGLLLGSAEQLSNASYLPVTATGPVQPPVSSPPA